jgi:hypothetical protein
MTKMFTNREEFVHQVLRVLRTAPLRMRCMRAGLAACAAARLAIGSRAA